MSDRDQFLSAIEYAAGDERFAVMLQLADWLHERGDERLAEAWTWIAKTKRAPRQFRDDKPCWFSHNTYTDEDFRHPYHIPVRLLEKQPRQVPQTLGDAYLNLARAYVLARQDGWRP